MVFCLFFFYCVLQIELLDQMKNIPLFNIMHGRHGSHQKEIQMELVYYLSDALKVRMGSFDHSTVSNSYIVWLHQLYS